MSAPAAEADVACASVAYVDPQAHRWFAQRTSRAADWPVDRLLAAKGDTRVSVVLPAPVPQATVGRIVQVIRRELVDRRRRAPPAPRRPSLALVVVGSGSTDHPIPVARDAGADVSRSRRVLCRAPP